MFAYTVKTNLNYDCSVYMHDTHAYMFLVYYVIHLHVSIVDRMPREYLFYIG